MVADNDPKCPNCGVEFTDFEETTEHVSASALDDLEKFIEDTAVDLDMGGGKNIKGTKADAKGPEEEQEKFHGDDISEFQDSDLDSLLDELDQLDDLL